MKWLFESLNSSIGKKLIMAVTGISLILFLVMHLFGNMFLFVGAEAFNTYVEQLEHIKPFVRVIEVVLASIFLLHILNGIRLWLENRSARPARYAVNGSSQNSNVFSRTMLLTGSLVFIFLVLHLPTFWYSFNFEIPAFWYSMNSGLEFSGEKHNFYNIVVFFFSTEWYAVVYVICMMALGFHLNHGFQSAFQTFGWNHKKYTPVINFIGTAYSILMAAGFASIPIFFLIKKWGGQ